MIPLKLKYFCINNIGLNQECESRLGSAAKQKQEDLDHLSRLLDGLQLDKDILTQLKVRKVISQWPYFWSELVV